MSSPDFSIDMETLMIQRGVVTKMLLDSVQHRTEEDLDQLNGLLELLHSFQDALEDGYTTVTVTLLSAKEKE